MKNLSAQKKIIIIALVWLIASLTMIFYVFGILDGANLETVAAIKKQKNELQTLQAQNQSFLQAKADIKKLAEQPYQPEDFFSRDITLVQELKVLEALKQKFNLQIQYGGVSGTVNNAQKAATISSLGMFPYNITVTGDFADAVNFIETMQNLSFITNISSISISAADKGMVNATMSASFYIKK